MAAQLPPGVIPEWIIGNETLMEYMQLLPITMMYVIPTALLLGITFLYFEEVVFRTDQFNVKGKTVVITGGSQGLGKALGKLFAKKGASVVIVARDKTKLREATEYISAAAKNPDKQRFALISADLTIPDEARRVISEVTEWNGNKVPDIVWANAGYYKPSLFLDASAEQLHEQFDVNYWAAVYLAQATLRAWLVPTNDKNNEITFADGTARKTKPEPRHFIMTSSVAAFVGLAGYTPYAPAKAAMRSLHDNLRSEVQMYNGANSQNLVPDVKIHTVFPGSITTPGLEEENKTKHPVTTMLEEGDSVQSEDEVAKIAFTELERGRGLITTQYVAAAMRASSLQGSVRDRWFVDTLFSSVAGIIWIFVAPDMERKVWKWGKKNGLPQHQA